MKFSTMLKGIRGEFDGGAWAYVCVALENKYGYEAQPLLKVIHKAIGCKEGTDEGEYTSVMDWLRENHWDVYEKEFMHRPFKQQAYRLAWIDQMIAMFKAEGN